MEYNCALAPQAVEAGTTWRVSTASDGEQGNNFSELAKTSSDGRYVAFASMASNMVQGDTNGFEDVFVNDRQTGQTTRVSISSGGGQGNARSKVISISADGRYVAFYSEASNLVPADTNGVPDVLVHDGQTALTTLVSVSSSGEQGNGYSDYPSLSADGRYVSFQSASNKLRQVDLVNGVVRLEASQSKNARARVLPFRAIPELAHVLHAQRDRTTALEKATNRIVPRVFWRGQGKPLRSF